MANLNRSLTCRPKPQKKIELQWHRITRINTNKVKNFDAFKDMKVRAASMDLSSHFMNVRKKLT